MSDLTDEQLDQQLWALMRLDALPRSRREALQLGMNRYFTGRPCPQGHFAERLVKNRQCVVCDRAYQRNYAKTHYAIRKQQQQRYRETHREELRIKGKLYSIYGTCKVDECKVLVMSPS